MMKIITAVTVCLVSVSVHSHDCKRYNLTASDQLLIDMMQHYLHTSRNECNASGSTDIGVVYTRWGRKRRGSSTDLVYTGRMTCYHGWNMEYNGYLMSAAKSHYRSEYSCVDMVAEPLDDKDSDENGALFYPVRAKCGSLRYPPYKDETDVYCVVCSK